MELSFWSILSSKVYQTQSLLIDSLKFGFYQTLSFLSFLFSRFSFGFMMKLIIIFIKIITSSCRNCGARFWPQYNLIVFLFFRVSVCCVGLCFCFLCSSGYSWWVSFFIVFGRRISLYVYLVILIEISQKIIYQSYS